MTQAGAAALLTVALAGGAYLSTASYLTVILAVQLLLVLTWFVGVSTSGRTEIAVVAIGAAAVADVVVLVRTGGFSGIADTDGTLTPLVGVIALGLLATVGAQLTRGIRRERVTEAFGSAMTLNLTVVFLAAALVLHTRTGGPAVMMASVGAAGSGLLVSAFCDVALPAPELAEGTGKSAFGILAAGAAGAVAAAISGSWTGLTSTSSPWTVGVAGAVVALTAVLVASGQSYAVAGQEQEGEVLARSTLRPILGTLLGLVVGIVGAYLLGSLIFG
jgi:hypothetical protein